MEVLRLLLLLDELPKQTFGSAEAEAKGRKDQGIVYWKECHPLRISMKAKGRRSNNFVQRALPCVSVHACLHVLLWWLELFPSEFICDQCLVACTFSHIVPYLS